MLMPDLPTDSEILATVWFGCFHFIFNHSSAECTPAQQNKQLLRPPAIGWFVKQACCDLTAAFGFNAFFLHLHGYRNPRDCLV